MSDKSIDIFSQSYEDAVFATLLALVQQKNAKHALIGSVGKMAINLQDDGYDRAELSKNIAKIADVVHLSAARAHSFYLKYCDNKRFNIRKKQKEEKHIEQIARIFRSIAKFVGEDSFDHLDVCRICARVYYELNINKKLVL